MPLTPTHILRADSAVVDSLSADSLSRDTLSTDSLAADSLTHPAIILQPLPENLHTATLRQDTGLRQTGSWIMLALLFLLVTVGVKFRNSANYLGLLVKEITNTRRRHNMFDDTVRETSFLLLLNVVALLSAGVLMYLYILCGKSPTLEGAAKCIGAVLAYGAFMGISYRVTGLIFSDREAMRIWIRGHLAAQGLLSFGLLPLALMAVVEERMITALIAMACGLFGIAKLLFVVKGARIFLSAPASILLFFYYLCSLEIVPLILTWTVACYLLA